MMVTVARGQAPAIRAAVRAWRAGRPHTAWEILDRAGLSEYWDTFRDLCLREARRRFVKRMAQ